MKKQNKRKLYIDSEFVLKAIIYVVFLAIIIFGPWVISAVTKTYDTYEKGSISDEEIITLINDNEEIFLHRNRPSFGASYDVVIDDMCVGTIKGKFISFFNDTMVFTTVNENTIAIAQEGFDLWRDSWVVTNENNEVSISVDANISLRTSYDVRDKYNVTIGNMTTNWLSLFKAGSIKNNSNEIAFSIDKKWTGNTYIVKKNSSDMTMLDAIMITTGFNKENEKSSGGSSKSSKSSK